MNRVPLVRRLRAMSIASIVLAACGQRPGPAVSNHVASPVTAAPPADAGGPTPVWYCSEMVKHTEIPPSSHVESSNCMRALAACSDDRDQNEQMFARFAKSDVTFTSCHPASDAWCVEWDERSGAHQVACHETEAHCKDHRRLMVEAVGGTAPNGIVAGTISECLEAR